LETAANIYNKEFWIFQLSYELHKMSDYLINVKNQNSYFFINKYYKTLLSLAYNLYELVNIKITIILN